MSSFLGHAVAPAILYVVSEPKDSPRRAAWAWLLVMMGLALAPDVDYLLGGLILTGSPPVRVTHSIAGCLALPAAVVLTLAIRGLRGRGLRLRAFQAASAGLSHVLLDLLVGVTPAPLLWPLSLQTFRLPGGILPSAGRLAPGNPYLYRNLLLEMGVLLPLLAIALLLRTNSVPRRRTHLLAIGALASVSLGCMLASAALAR